MSNLIRPLHDRVIVRANKKEDVSAGGIVIPDSASEKPSEGVVIATGTGKVLKSGKIIPMAVKEGDRVLFGQYAGQEIKVAGEDVLVMNEEDIIAVVT